jgi:two-component sensor histidine kinase
MDVLEPRQSTGEDARVHARRAVHLGKRTALKVRSRANIVKRIDPCGWDSEDRTYFLFDDDRLYRQTDPPIPSPASRKAKSKLPPKSSRSSKRRRLSRVIPDTTPEDDSEEEALPNGVEPHALDYEENFAGRKWECVAITLDDYNKFLDTIKRSRDPDEKNLFKFITNDVIPILHQREEERQRKELRRLRELENLHKLATAKRSSRLADKLEKKKEQEAAEEAERKRIAELEMAHKELAKQRRMEEVCSMTFSSLTRLMRTRTANLE